MGRIIEVISFDGSYRQGFAGIGIHNVTTDEKLSFTFEGKYIQNSFMAETMALIQAVRYISKRGNQRHYLLYTDSIELYRKGIDPVLREKYLKDIEIVHLYWHPRGNNVMADKLAQLQPSCQQSRREQVRSLPTNEKFALIEQFCTSNDDFDFIYSLKNGIAPTASSNSGNRQFINFVFACFVPNELKALEEFRKQFSKRPSMKEEKFKRMVGRKNKHKCEEIRAELGRAKPANVITQTAPKRSGTL